MQGGEGGGREGGGYNLLRNVHMRNVGGKEVAKGWGRGSARLLEGESRDNK